MSRVYSRQIPLKHSPNWAVGRVRLHFLEIAKVNPKGFLFVNVFNKEVHLKGAFTS